VKTFGRFSSHRRFEHQKNISGRIFESGDRHPTLSTWFTSEYKKSGKKLDMGKGCVRFKSLEDLALGVRFAGRELYGGRPRAVASWSREAGAAVLVETGLPYLRACPRRSAWPRSDPGECL
jgi:hypothetical protein